MVYEAFDQQVRSLVALKVLRFGEADALYRFKKDFRALADIRHPNLVSFYELFTEEGLWFFSMELVPGCDFIEALAGERDFDRIRRVVQQLASGLHMVHRHGKVHRDIKPPNVLVTQEDRAVLLDFGLVTEFQRIGLPELEPQTVGTPAYMSPEQALALPGTPASDWYSVGVMLYQTLTGQLPFGGSALEIMADKQTGKPQPMEGIPGDLEELCLGLLDPDPEKRLRGTDVLRQLASRGDPIPRVELRDDVEAPFVGREQIFAELDDSLAASASGTVAVYLRGASGMGKSTLIKHFVSRVHERDATAVVLSGRCYLQESVPYKALDSLVDALSRYLRGLPEIEVKRVLPSQAAPLAVLFPVLLRVAAIASLRSEELEPQLLRRRAFAGLRLLLERLAARGRVVLVIDDLQWGDMDSFVLLDEILRPPDPPPILLIGAYRSEDEASSPFLRALSEHRESLRWRGVDVRELEIGKLSRDQAEGLIGAFASQGSELASRRVERILQEADGNPLFLSELSRFALQRVERRDAIDASVEAGPGAGPGTGAADLRDVIMARLDALPAASRRLLTMIAVAGKPVDLSAARQAADLGSAGADALAQLRSNKLVRQRAGGNHEEVEAYHDRIREAAVDSLDTEALRDAHHALALALESSGRADPETLAVHFQATEEMVRARDYAITAAGRAEETLAFERAARLYRQALDLCADEYPERYGLEVKLGEALANAGRSREAAETFLQAVGHSGTINPVEAQRHAAEKLLISGHIDRGMAILRHVLRTMGMSLPKRAWKALLDLWWHRLRLRWRGLAFKERSEADCAPVQLRCIDACWSVEIGLCLVDVLRASQFHARHLLLALEAGEPDRISRGLAMEIFFGSMEGASGDEVAEQARWLANRVRGGYAACLIEMAEGMLACSKGEWDDGCRSLESAETHLREARRGGAWELDTVRHFRVVASLHLGAWQPLFAELPSLLEPARSQGDLYLEIHLIHWVVSFQHLVEDRPRAAREALRESIRNWSHTGFHFQHFGHLYAEAQIDLYEGRGALAWERLARSWDAVTKSMIQRIGMVLILSHDLRARCALAAAAEEGCESSLRPWYLACAERSAKKLAHAGSRWSIALASQVRAGIGSVRHRHVAVSGHAAVSRHLDEAAAAFDDSGMVVHAGVARWRATTWSAATVQNETAAGSAGGVSSTGAADRNQARHGEAVLAERGGRRPDQLATVFAPGCWKRAPMT